MYRVISPLLLLFASVFILMLGNGLINILLPVRLSLESVDTDSIGLILSLYAVGLLLGGMYSGHLIQRAGHIRVFAFSAALGAISILVCSLYTDTWLWAAMRIVIGFSNACAYSVMDGWLSDSSTPKTRGRILATNQVVMMGAMFIGQFLMVLADPMTHLLFVLAGIILCFSVIPVSMNRNPGPIIETNESMPILKLYKRSPLGVISCFFCGILYSAIFNMLPIFAADNNITGLQLSWFMGSSILGAFLLQFPVGYLSDTFSRRTVMLYVIVVSAVAGLLIPIMLAADQFLVVLVLNGITAGICACLYPMSIAEAFDRLKQSEMVGAMGSLIMVFAVGSMIGPYSSSLVIKWMGSGMLFTFLAVIQGGLAFFIVYRMQVRESVPSDEQEDFVMQGAAMPIGVHLDPRTPD